MAWSASVYGCGPGRCRPVARGWVVLARIRVPGREWLRRRWIARQASRSPVPGRLPTRIFTTKDDPGAVVSDDGDRPTSYLVLFGHGDQPADR
jgi:hypothetical protein